MNKLITIFMFFCISFIAAEELEIGFIGISSENTNFKAFEKYIEKDGAQEVVSILANELKHVKVNYNFNSRYILVSAINDIKIWGVTFAHPAERMLTMAECHLHVLLYDCYLQKEVLRNTFIAYEALANENNPSSLELLKKAFRKSVRLVGEQIKGKLSTSGKIIEASGLGKITVNLGTKDNLSDNNILQVFDPNGKLIEDYIIQKSKLVEDSCVAIPENDINVFQHPWQDYVVKIKVNPVDSDIINDETHIFAKTLGVYEGHIREPLKKQQQPNPIQRIAITHPKNGTEIYMGSGTTPGASQLRAVGIDAWGDEVTLVENELFWQGEGGSEDMLSGSQFVHKRAGNNFSIRAKYKGLVSDPIKISVIRINSIHLDYEKVTLLPHQALKFKLTGVNTQEKDVDSASLQYQVEWTSSNPELGEINNGEFIAGENAGELVVTVSMKSNSLIKARCHVLILPSVEIDIMDLDGNSLNSSISLAPRETIKMQYNVTKSVVDNTLIPIEWFVEPDGYGQGEIIGSREWSFSAGDNPIRGLKIRPVIRYVPVGTERRDQIKTIYVSIAHKRTDRLEITFSPKPDFFYVDEPFQIRIQGYHQQEILKNLNIDVRAIPSRNAESPVDEGYGYYTIIPKDSGPMTLLARDQDSGAEATIPIIVKEQDKVSKIEIVTEGHRREIRPGSTLLFTAKAFKGDEVVDNAKFYWRISPQNNKTMIDQGGLVTTSAEDIDQEYEITVTEEISQKKASLKIKIVPEPVATVEVDAPKTLVVGEKYPLITKIIGKDGNRLKRKISWRVDGKGSIDENNFISASETGYLRIFPIVDKFEGESFVIKIENSAWGRQNENANLKKIEKIDVVNEEQATLLAPGERVRFIAKVIGTDGTVLSNLPIAWSVSNTVHSIGPDGYFVAGAQEGIVKIIAKNKDSDVVGEYQLSVRWPSIADIKIETPIAILSPGQTIPLYYNVYDKKGKLVDNYKVVFDVDGGEVNKQGNHYEYKAPYITGKYKILCFDAKKQVISNPITIIVKKETKQTCSFDSIKISPNYTELEVGETCQFNAKGFSTSTQQYSPNIDIDWSTDSKQHTIDQNGRFKAGIEEGAVYVYARSENITAKVRVVIKRSPRRIIVDPYVVKVWTKNQTTFKATVLDSLEQPIEQKVTWSCTGDNIINSYTGVFTAGHKPGSYQVKAEINGIYAIAEVEVASQNRSDFVYHELSGFKYLAHKSWQKQSFIPTQNIYFIDEFTGIYAEALYVGDLSDSELDREIKSIEEMMFSTFGTYNKHKMRDFSVGSLNGKVADYTTTYQGKSTLARSFYCIHNSHLYIFYFYSLEDSWQNNWDIFKITLFSIEADKNFTATNPLVTVQEMKYGVSYDIDINWKKEVTVDSETEIATRYWRNDYSYIQFDFFDSYGYTLDQWISMVESNVFPQLFSPYKKSATVNHSVNGISGKLITFDCYPVTVPNQKFKGKAFFGLSGTTIYAVYYIYPANAIESFDVLYLESLNSLKFDSSATSQNPYNYPDLTKDTTKSDSWKTIEEKAYDAKYEVKSAWRQEMIINSKTEVAYRYWLDNYAYLQFDFFEVPSGSNLETMIPFVATNLFAKNYYWEVKREDKTLNKLKGKMVHYQASVNNDLYDFEIFHAIYNNKMYITLYVCLVGKDEAYRNVLRKSTQSLNVKIKEVTTKEPDNYNNNKNSKVEDKYHSYFDVSYQVQKEWREEKVSDTSAEVAYRYWKNNYALIMFDFFPITPGMDLDFLISQVELTLFPSWCTYTAKSKTNKTIDKFKGKKVTYRLTQTDAERTRYHSEIFYAIHKNNMYLVYYACPLKEKESYRQPFIDAMESLKIGKIAQYTKVDSDTDTKIDYSPDYSKQYDDDFALDNLDDLEKQLEKIEKQLDDFGDSTTKTDNNTSEKTNTNTNNTYSSGNWLDVKDSNFNMMYKVKKEWNVQEISNTKDETAYIYWNDNYSYIQFDFFPTIYGMNQDETITLVAQNLFGSWCRSYSAVSTKSSSLNGIPGKHIVYKLIQNDTSNSEYYCEAFFGEQNNNVYLVLYLCLASESKSFRQPFIDSMNSLKSQSEQSNYGTDQSQDYSYEDKKEVFYSVIVSNATIDEYKTNGNKWDFGWGKASNPDTFVTIEDKSSYKKFTSQVVKNNLYPYWDQVTSLTIKENTKLEIGVYDDDSSNNDSIGTKEVTITKSDLEKGEITLQFGQVQSLKLMFVKSP